MMLLYEEDGVFNPTDFGLKVGDIIQVVGIGGGGGGTAGIYGYISLLYESSPKKHYVYLSGGGGNSGQFKSQYIKLASLEPVPITIGKGGNPGTKYSLNSALSFQISYAQKTAVVEAIKEYLQNNDTNALGKAGTATTLGNLCSFLGGSGGSIGPIRQGNVGSWAGGLGMAAITTSTGSPECNGAGGAGGFIPGLNIRGGAGVDGENQAFGSNASGFLTFIEALFGSRGRSNGSLMPRYLPKYGGAPSCSGSAPGGADGADGGANSCSGGGGGGYGAGGGGGTVASGSTIYTGGAGADGCLLIFF